MIAIRLCYHLLWRLFQLSTIYAQTDYDLADIQPVDEAPSDYGPARNRHINNLNDEHARMLTRFNKNRLFRLLTQFDFPVHCMVPSHGDRHYHMGREEILLFSLTKMAHGLDTNFLCLVHFGGCPKRFEKGYKYFLRHLDSRYYPRVLGFEGIARYVHHFPYYARRTWRKAREPNTYRDRATNQYVTTPGYAGPLNTFCTALLTDGLYYESNNPGTGPDGNIIGAPRRPNAYVVQCSVYSGYKMIYGLVVLSLFLPIGITFIYGPCSARWGERRMVNESGVDQFLLDLQMPHFQGWIYGCFGDSAFRNGFVLFNNNDVNLKGLCESVKWDYGEVSNLWKICANPSMSRINDDSSIAKEQLRICYLLSNCYT